MAIERVGRISPDQSLQPNPSDADSTLLSVEDLRTSFMVGNHEFRAVDGVSFTVGQGEVVGLVGESGSGKSLTALSLMRLVPHPGRIVGGHAWFEGVDLVTCPEETMQSIRGRKIGMIFQDPQTALNPMLTIGALIREGLQTHFAISKREATDRALSLLQKVHIPDPYRIMQSYPHELSGGMKQRVMVAIAVSCEPRLMLADEPTTALDVTVQAQILELIIEAAHSAGAAMVLITHDLAVVAGYTSKVVVMFAGRVVETAPTRDVFYSPRHPYTAELIRTTPRLDRRGRRRSLSPNHGFSESESVSGGCPYAPRCEYVESECLVAEPKLELSNDHHSVACWVKPKLETV